MPTLDDALNLAAAGWPLLPLNGKIPRTAHGVKDASTDPATIRAWWRSGDHNAGARIPSGLIVLDFDPQNGGSVAALVDAARCDLPVTLIVHTGRGDGSQHRYYRHPGIAVSARRLPPGIDVKTDTGYCVVPPSVHPVTGLPYRWELHPVAELPPEVLALLRPRPRAAPLRTSKATTASRAQHLIDHVAQLGDGNRNAGLFWAASRARAEGHGDDVFDALAAAAETVGLSPTEAARTIDSARREVNR